jgi:hypothetical protein
MSAPNPKRIFQVVITILGLTLALGGLWMAIGALIQTFNPPSYTELLGRVELPATVKMLLDGKQLEGSALVKQVVFTFVVEGCLPLFLGLCFIRAGGFFRRLDRGGGLGPGSALGCFFLPRMSLALARIEDEIERGYQPFKLGNP